MNKLDAKNKICTKKFLVNHIGLDEPLMYYASQLYLIDYTSYLFTYQVWKTSTHLLNYTRGVIFLFFLLHEQKRWIQHFNNGSNLKTRLKYIVHSLEIILIMPYPCNLKINEIRNLVWMLYLHNLIWVYFFFSLSKKMNLIFFEKWKYLSFLKFEKTQIFE